MPNVGQARACWVGLMGPRWETLLRARGLTPTPAGVPCREERDEGRNARSLGVGQGRELPVGRAAEPESPEFIGEPLWLDPPERLEELDERDPGRIGGAEQIGRRRTRPRWPGGVEERRDVSRVAPEGGTEGPHREARAGEDFSEPCPEFVVAEHRLILS